MSLLFRHSPGGTGTYPPAPDGLTIYVVGDVHGRLDLLAQLHRDIDMDRAKSKPSRPLEIYLGDYIDRGPYSRGVVSRLLHRARHVQTIFLRGNHEQLLLDFLEGQDCLQLWTAIGGVTTLLSYGVKTGVLAHDASAEAVRRSLAGNLPHDHRLFFAETRPYVHIPPYLMVHAGIRPHVSLENQNVSDLLTIRHGFLEYEGDFGCIVVHGHTPVMAPELRRYRINIDTGAFATNRLTCLRIAQDGARIMAGCS